MFDYMINYFIKKLNDENEITSKYDLMLFNGFL